MIQSNILASQTKPFMFLKEKNPINKMFFKEQFSLWKCSYHTELLHRNMRILIFLRNVPTERRGEIEIWGMAWRRPRLTQRAMREKLLGFWLFNTWSFYGPSASNPFHVLLVFMPWYTQSATLRLMFRICLLEMRSNYSPWLILRNYDINK